MHTFLLDFTIKSSSNTDICTASPAKVDSVVGPGQTHERREREMEEKANTSFFSLSSACVKGHDGSPFSPEPQMFPVFFLLLYKCLSHSAKVQKHVRQKCSAGSLAHVLDSRPGEDIHRLLHTHTGSCGSLPPCFLSLM